MLFSATSFLPHHDKYEGCVCQAVHVHVLNRDEFRPFASAALLLESIKRLHPDRFAWVQGIRESPSNNGPAHNSAACPFIDLLAGTDRLRAVIDMGGCSGARRAGIRCPRIRAPSQEHMPWLPIWSDSAATEVVMSPSRAPDWGKRTDGYCAHAFDAEVMAGGSHGCNANGGRQRCARPRKLVAHAEPASMVLESA